jgi:hypothetical protein
MGIIYLAKSPSGKSYIGQHGTNDFKKRKTSHYKKFREFTKRKLFLALERKFNPTKTIAMNMKGCCTALYSACLKYGFQSFEWKILHTNVSKNQLNILEDKEILSRNTLAPHGYNLKINGKIEGYSYSQEARHSQSEIQKTLMKNNYVKYRKHIQKLEGLPQHTSYQYNETAGNHFMVIGHPKCAKKMFSSKTISVDVLKQIFTLFMEKLEESNKHPDILALECYEHFGQLKGLYRNKVISGGYIVQFFHKKKRYIKQFNKKTEDVNHQEAIKWLSEQRRKLMKSKEEGSETK